MPLPTNTNRPNLPYTPDQSLPNNSRFDLLGRRPPTAEMFDAELNALTDDVNRLAAAINEVEAGNIPGSDNPLNANKVIKTDGEGHLSFTLIHSHQLAAGAVVEAALAVQSVTSTKLGDGAVSQDKMAADSVATGNLVDGAVVSAKIADGAITTDKIAEGAIDSDKIGDGAVTTDKIAECAVNYDSLDPALFRFFSPPGLMMEWTAATPPRGWLFADGQAVSRTTYRLLFQTIGTTFGAGDGSTTFNLPDKRGRVSVGCFGSDTGGRVTAATAPGGIGIGKTGGLEQVTLTIPQIPAHTHQISIDWGNGNSESTEPLYHGGTSGYNRYITDSCGGGQPHNNMPPFLLMPFIISTGVYA